MDDKVLKAKLGNGRIRRRAKMAMTNRKTAKLAHGAIYYFRKLASRIFPSGDICPPVTPEDIDAVMRIGCFARFSMLNPQRQQQKPRKCCYRLE